MECADYREYWTRAEGSWRLASFEEAGGASWPLGVTPPDPKKFPVVEGESMASPDQPRSWSSGNTSQDDWCGCRDVPYAREPRPKRTVQPNYPEFAKEAQIQGRVVLSVCITTSGRVCNIHVEQGVTGLNDAAMDAVKRWEFDPARDEQGRPLAVWFSIPVDFHF